MITLSVLSFNGAAGDGSLSVAFDELGGTIGRADTNQMVLPDPERTISRVHAQVVYRNGRYAVVDRGSNPIAVNGRPLGNGQEAPIQAGDQVQIGGYLIEVRAAAAAAQAADPFADLLGGLPSGPAAEFDPLAGFGLPPAPAPAAAAANARTPARPAAPAAWPGTSPAAPGAAGAADWGAPVGAGLPPASPPAAGGIPDDWDPFAAPPPAALPDALGIVPRRGANLGLDAGAAAPAALIPEFDTRADAASLDSLFGLGAAPQGADPLGGSILQAPMAQPNMAASVDPLASLSMAPQASAPSRPDNLSDLNRPFIPPPLASPSLPPSAPPVAPAAPAGAVLSWDAGDGAAEGHTVIRPRSAAPASAPAAPGTAAPVPAAPARLPDDLLGDLLGDMVAPAPGRFGMAGPAPAAASGAVPASAPSFAPTPARAPAPTSAPTSAPTPATPAPVAAPFAGPEAAVAAPFTAPAAAGFAAPAAPAQVDPATAALPADLQALLVAFREGLATPTVPVPTLTPELMRLLGQLLHEATRGTVELLVARAAMKREVRAEATMIMARENNPLKFSPSVEAALGHLLAPPTRGFMPAGPAMRDAYDDLRAHQFGMVAGMRAALDGVLARFDPALLEGRLAQLSALQSILPGARKAKLWEAFTELYGQIRSDAAEDFHSVFGKAFLKAYEEHIEQLQGSDR